MSEKYAKNVTIALTEEDHAHMSECAHADRRSLAQYLSIMIEKEIDARRKATEVTKGSTDG